MFSFDLTLLFVWFVCITVKGYCPIIIELSNKRRSEIDQNYKLSQMNDSMFSIATLGWLLEIYNLTRSSTSTSQA